MRYTEFWSRLEQALGPVRARVWAEDHVLTSLGGRSPAAALAAGEDPKMVWRAVHAALELPERER